MRFIRGAGIGLFLAVIPTFGVGCTSLSPKLYTLPAIARHRADSQFQAARQAEQTGQYTKARELYASLQRQSPKNVEFAHRMAVVCTRLGDHETAAKYFEHAQHLAPRDPAVLADMGYAAFLCQSYERAETLLRESVQLNPNDVRAVNNLAMAIGFQGRYEESLLTFRRVNPEAQSQIDVAYIHTQRGELERAVERYRLVLKLDPDNAAATNALVQLTSTLPPGVRPLPATDPNAVADTRLTSRDAASAPATHDLPPASDSSEFVAPLTQVTPSPSANAWYEDYARQRDGEFPIVGESSAADRPVIASTEELPALSDGLESPRIRPDSLPSTQPDNGAWASTNESRRELPLVTPIVASDSEFQLPTPVDRPDELAADEEDGQPLAKEGSAIRDELADVFDGGDNAPERVIPDSDELVGLEWAADDLARRASGSPADSAGTVQNGECLKGYCAVALRDERRLAPVSDEFSTEYQAQIYKFSSAEALARFQEHPEFYVPAAGGLDIIQVRRGAAVVQGSLDHAVWFRHRLHLFSTAENLADFRAAPREFASAP